MNRRNALGNKIYKKYKLQPMYCSLVFVKTDMVELEYNLLSVVI